MKTFVKTLLFYAVITLCTSCKKADEPGGTYIPEPDEYHQKIFWVVKFTKPSYKDYIVVVEPYEVDGDWEFAVDWSLFGNYADGNKTYFGKSLSDSPYIELTNSYLLVDWRWVSLLNRAHNTFRANDQLVVLTELKWSDFTGFLQKYSKDTPHDHKAFTRAYEFSAKVLDIYRGDSLTERDKDIFYKGQYYSNYSDKNVISMDSIQNIYVGCLKEILEKYDLGEKGGLIKTIE